MRLPQDYRSLARVLKSWSIAPASDPGFSEKVWRRIATGEGGDSFGTFFRVHRAVIVAAFILAIALGGWGGWAAADARTKSNQMDLAAIYVHSVDARWIRTR